MNISHSVVADCEPIAAVIREAAAWLESQGRPLWRSAAITAESVRHDVEAGRFIVARESSEIVGVVRFQLQDPEYWPELKDDTSAFLHRLAVRRSVAGKGVSIALLAAGLEQAKIQSRTHLRLDCIADRTKLRQLYENFGFAFHSYHRVGSSTVARYQMATGESR